VGIELKKLQGDAVKAGENLCLVHGREAERIDAARSIVQSAYSIGGQEKRSRERVMEEIRDDDLGKD
jgi:thymidine phosphorylase